MQEWLIQIAHNHQYLVYIVIIVLACAEGPILSMIFGVLIKLGYFGFWPVYGALMLGDLIGDVIWYHIGKYFGHGFIKRFGKYVGVTEEKVAGVTHIFHKYKHSILFISKITSAFGFAVATLFTAGMVGIPFRKYIIINFLGQFIWSGLLIASGYFFGNLYLNFNNVLSRIFIVIFFFFLFLAFKRYKDYMNKKLSE